MAGFFNARQAGDLAVGKPPLHMYSKNLSVGDALKALKNSNDLDLSLWEELCPLTEKPIKEAHSNARETVCNLSCHQVLSNGDGSGCLQGSKESLWRCVGKMGMVDIICFLARDESLANQGAALRTPVSSIVSDSAFAIQHVDSRSKLFDALAHVRDGVQHLVVSIERSISSRLARYNSMPKPRRGLPQTISKPKHGKSLDSQFSLPQRATTPGIQQYCWLTPEDILQFLLSCIGLFSPLPMMTIENLGIINYQVLTVNANADAITALASIQRAAREMTAVAVVEPHDSKLKLVGEISPFTLKGCDKRAALALATLSVREFLAFSEGACSPLTELVESRICAKLENLQASHEELLSDSDSPVSFPSPLSSSTASFGILNTIYSLDSGEELSSSSSSSSDEDCNSHSPTSPFSSLHRPSSHSYPKGRLAPNLCRPWSSLVAVMAQALTHRVGYIWVTDDENSLQGIVTYLDIIHCILSHLYPTD